jgi:hypothetical protein
LAKGSPGGGVFGFLQLAERSSPQRGMQRIILVRGFMVLSFDSMKFIKRTEKNIDKCQEIGESQKYFSLNGRHSGCLSEYNSAFSW